MGLLDGGLQPLVGAAFGWIMIDGVLRSIPLVDNGKGGFTEGTPVDVPIKYMEEAATREMREEQDFEQTDVALLILAEGVPYPTSDHHMVSAQGTYDLKTPITREGAMTYYMARGRKR